jgi:hypothetical protein
MSPIILLNSIKKASNNNNNNNHVWEALEKHKFSFKKEKEKREA